MKTYEGANIRNVALVGHSHSGKTSLVSAMLFTAGATQRLGRVDEGNTVTDYDEEEISRSMSLSRRHRRRRVGQDEDQPDRHARLQHVHSRSRDGAARRSSRRWSWSTPSAALRSSPSASGNTPTTFLLPRAIVCTRMDRERADFTRVMESLTNAFGRTVVPVQLPIGSEKSFTGVIDLVKMQAYTYEMGGNGKATVGPIPDNMAGEAKAAHEKTGRVGCRRRRRADGRVLRKGHHRRGAHHQPACTTPFAKTRSSPCSSLPAWATWAPTKCWTSSSTTCRRRSSAAR